MPEITTAKGFKLSFQKFTLAKTFSGFVWAPAAPSLFRAGNIRNSSYQGNIGFADSKGAIALAQSVGVSWESLMGVHLTFAAVYSPVAL